MNFEFFGTSPIEPELGPEPTPVPVSIPEAIPEEKPELKKVEVPITIPQPTLLDYVKCASKYLLKPGIGLILLGLLIGFVTYHFSIQLHVAVYRVELMLWDYEIPLEYVYARFPNMNVVSLVVVVIVGFAPIVIGEIHQIWKFKKKFSG